MAIAPKSLTSLGLTCLFGGNGQADVNLPIAGPSGSASVHAIASKKTGGNWEFTELTAVIEGTGKTVDLRQR